jgi:NCAIR mutase (PurE)-related protein
VEDRPVTQSHRVDTDRLARTGDPECVLASGKTTQEVLECVEALRNERAVLITRCSPETLAALSSLPDAVIHERSGCATVGALPEPSGQVVVVSGGTSDAPVVEEACVTVRAHAASVTRIDDVGVAGLHRVLAVRDVLAAADCLVVVAGMEGALPSVVAGLVGTPVVAVPTSTGYGVGAGGYAALMAMLSSCAPGVVVVNVDNGYGAGVHAARVARGAAGVRVVTAGSAAGSKEPPVVPAGSDADLQDLVVLESNVDDLDPRVWPTVLGGLLEAGALDAWLTPILMKKGRPAHTVHALVPGALLAAVQQVVFERTTAIGVRLVPVRRQAVERRSAEVSVDGVAVRVKVSLHQGRVTQVQPEWEDVAAAAAQLQRPARAVLAAAQAAAQHLW